MRNWIKILLFVLLFGGSNFVYSQEPQIEGEVVEVKDTTKHSPKRATLMSTIIPGAGQFYNKKYWKIPIIYIAGGAMVYSALYNSVGYHSYRNAYNHLYENPDDPMEGFEGYNLEQLKSIKDQYRRYRDLSIIGVTLLYVLNIVDATVDGYLFDYDVSDDLSLRLEPSIMGTYYNTGTFKASNQFGFKCTLNF